MLSIVVSWRDREQLSDALPSLLETVEILDGEVIIVNFSGSDELLKAQLEHASSRVSVVKVTDQEYFNKAAAQNSGASVAKHPVLFFCDCDIILNPSDIVDLVNKLNAQEQVFATLAGVKETEVKSRGGNHVVSGGCELNISTADGRRLQIIDTEEDAENGTRQAPGLLLVKKSDFIAINGYNNQLHGWGWEDQDMISRLTLGQGLTRICLGTALHISHGDDARIAFYPEVNSRWESRDRMFRTALANYDQANFMGSYDKDIATLNIARVKYD